MLYTIFYFYIDKHMATWPQNLNYIQFSHLHNLISIFIVSHINNHAILLTLKIKRKTLQQYNLIKNLE
jgi:hypothetical protein